MCSYNNIGLKKGVLYLPTIRTAAAQIFASLSIKNYIPSCSERSRTYFPGTVSPDFPVHLRGAKMKFRTFLK